MSLNIRSVIPEDRDAWLNMVVDYDPDVAAQAERDWERLISGGIEARCLITTIGGQPVAFAHTLIHDFVFRRRPCLYLADLYVRPEFRRQGIARAMLRHVVDEAKEAGCGRVYWLTENDSVARGFYDEVGTQRYVRYHIDF